MVKMVFVIGVVVGIGCVCVFWFVCQGYQIGVFDLDKVKVQVVVDEIEVEGGKVYVFVVSIVD